MKTITLKDIQHNTNKLNDKALETTEKIALKTIAKAEKLQNFTAKKVKNTLACSEKKQDALFNTLEKGKKMSLKKIKKIKSFFSKN